MAKSFELLCYQIRPKGSVSVLVNPVHMIWLMCELHRGRVYEFL